jgi:hypothetical protein
VHTKYTPENGQCQINPSSAYVKYFCVRFIIAIRQIRVTTATNCETLKRYMDVNNEGHVRGRGLCFRIFCIFCDNNIFTVCVKCSILYKGDGFRVFVCVVLGRWL